MKLTAPPKWIIDGGHGMEKTELVIGKNDIIASLDEIAASCMAVPWALDATYRLALSLIAGGVPGDFVECGVYAGSHPAAMAKAIIDSGTSGRKVHLFDSFQGIPLPGLEDKDWHEGDPVKRPYAVPGIAEIRSTGVAACSRLQVEQNMRRWGIPQELLEYHEGWFQDTMPGVVMPKGIAMLRLDADLFTSTSICMASLYPLVNHGGWCICDDFTLDGCRKVVLSYLLKPWNCPVYWRVTK